MTFKEIFMMVKALLLRCSDITLNGKGGCYAKIYNGYLIHGKVNIDNFTVVILVESTISKSITYGFIEDNQLSSFSSVCHCVKRNIASSIKITNNLVK